MTRGPDAGLSALVWRVIGWLMVGLALVGIALPLVPTTPFLLLAAFCFSRGSPRLHQWLLNHPRLGPPIAHWNEHRAIARTTKFWALGSLAVLGGLSWVVGAPPWVLATQAVVLCTVGIVLVTRREPPPADPEGPPGL